MLEFVQKRCVYVYVAIKGLNHGSYGLLDFTDFRKINRAMTQDVIALLKKSMKSLNPYNL